MLRKGLQRLVDPQSDFLTLAFRRFQYECRRNHTFSTAVGRFARLKSVKKASDNERFTTSFARLRSGGDNPVVTAQAVDDFSKSWFVADPFLYIDEDDVFHLFFEIGSQHYVQTPDAVIGHAASDDHGQSWTYDRIALDLGVHVSFPYVFESGGQVYMLPEYDVGSDTAVTLYTAKDSMTSWEKVRDLVTPEFKPCDSVIFEYRDRWWLLTNDSSTHSLHCYVADSLTGDWTPHAGNPVVSNRSAAARPGGRPVIQGDSLYVYFQDCADTYGKRVREYEITTLTESRYIDTETVGSPVVEPTDTLFGWRAGWAHHVDFQRFDGEWVGVFDGDIAGMFREFTDEQWSIGFCRERPRESDV